MAISRLLLGSRLENGVFDLNAHQQHFSANAFFGGNAQLPSATINSLNRTSQDTLYKQTVQLIQSGTTNFSRGGLQSGAGFSWDLTNEDNISGSLNYNYFGNSNSGVLNRRNIIEDEFGDTLSNLYDEINTSNKFNQQSFDYSLNYKKTFGGRRSGIKYQADFFKRKKLFELQSTHKETNSQIGYDNASYGNNPGNGN